MNGPERPGLKVALTGICAYEGVALGTGKVPTISSWMWARHPLVRALLWLVVVVVLTDHFFTRRWT